MVEEKSDLEEKIEQEQCEYADRCAMGEYGAECIDADYVGCPYFQKFREREKKYWTWYYLIDMDDDD